MTRTELDQKLKGLQDEVLLMGSLVEKAVEKSVDALKRRDLELSRKVVAEDDIIDRKRMDIEEKCIQVIATQEPVARDLRFILAVLNIIVDLERMADHAEGIGKISIMMGDQPPLKPLIDIPRMANKANEMLKRSLNAFAEKDVESARNVCSSDDEVDALYDQVYRELLTFMLKDPTTIDRATHLLWVAHNLERIGDRATNIAERVIFLVTGKMVSCGVSKY
ncbi:MAG: phosphate signaling complex protein PhoU [Dehalococcoidia bacterium]|nr:phosphate signaling complex protein PhoU [Dehalococcoidia bacterium]